MESSINGWWIIPFKKFGMVRVNMKSRLCQKGRNAKNEEKWVMGGGSFSLLR